MLSYFPASGTIDRLSSGSNLPYQHGEYSARLFAETALLKYGGLPADARLSEVFGEQRTQYPLGFSGGPPAPERLTYVFVWRHADGSLPNDRIEVSVENLRYAIGPFAVYPNHLHALWRTWRRLGEPVRIVDPSAPPGPAGYRALSQLDAFTLSSCRWPFKGRFSRAPVVRAVSTYWAPSFLHSTQVAMPGYDFYYADGYVMTVDARTGALVDGRILRRK